MIQTLLLSAMLAGVPVPELVGRPIAERLEVLSRREPWYGDMVTARLWHSGEVPSAREIHAFPPFRTIVAYRDFQWAHIQWLNAQVEMFADMPAEQAKYRDWLRDVSASYDFWYHIQTAQTEWVYVWQKRLGLDAARKLVGLEAWAAEQWPDFIPLWRFRNVD